MSNFSYDDFAVLVRDFSLESMVPESLRIIPLDALVSMADAIKGGQGLALEDGNAYLPLEKNGARVSSNVTVQHQSDGYCRLVGHLEAEASLTAKTFVLYQHGEGGNDKVLAVASIKAGFEIGEGCYPSFTITTVNNYQSVAFNPNAFATVEDLKNINGLDGLHIAFDQSTGDIKLLDKDGNVIDQANLPIKADVIIADGEEGYKYVKTDIQQDIHAAKAWMPEGSTAWETVDEVPYEMQHAALVVKTTEAEGTRWFVTEDGASYRIERNEDGNDVIYVGETPWNLAIETEVWNATNGDTVLTGTVMGETFYYDDGDGGVEYPFVSNDDGNFVYVDGNPYEATLSERETIWKATDGIEQSLRGMVTDRMFVTEQSDSFPIVVRYDNGNVIDIVYIDGVLYEIDPEPREDGKVLAREEGHEMWGTIETAGGSSTSDVVGIAVSVDGEKVMYAIDEDTPVTSISGENVPWLVQTDLPDGSDLRYGLEAFVWTVKDPDAVTQGSFFAALNDSLLSLGFHEGDDIALGTNLDELAGEDYVGATLDAEEYMHGEGTMELRAKEVADQRNLAKAELVAWNAQHPALTHNGTAGTRISSDGVDIRDGKLLIGDGSGLADNVKHYELSTTFSEYTDKRDAGLALSVVDASNAEPRNVLTISDSGYISGAPVCMAMFEIRDDDGLYGELGRRTACFDCEMEEPSGLGTVNLKIRDNRPNSKGFSDEGFRGNWIVEISPVYISGGTAPEMLPALNTVNTVATVSEDDVTELNCTCPQIIDWANSINLGEGEEPARLFVIVKVY